MTQTTYTRSCQLKLYQLQNESEFYTGTHSNTLMHNITEPEEATTQISLKNKCMVKIMFIFTDKKSDS